MPVYLRGDFSVEPLEQGFRATAPQALPEQGDLTAAGLPFYRGWVSYRYKINLSEPSEGLRIELPAFEAAAARVWIDDDAESVQTVLHPPYSPRFEQPVAAGEHVVTLQLATSLRNMMGPHHVRGLNGIWSWQLAPRHQPAGKDYVLDHFGIGAPGNPIISNPNR
jgi:hypothetical protein